MYVLDSGKKQRLDILEKSFENRILSTLQNHSWKYEILSRNEIGEYLKIKIFRVKVEKKFALMYTSGTKNDIYKALDRDVDLIVINGQLYNVDAFAYGINTPVVSIDEFFNHLKQWNIESDSEDLIMDSQFKRKKSKIEFPTRIQSEVPINQVWQHLKLFSNESMARSIIQERIERETVSLSADKIKEKSIGLAFCMQNAYDYFQEQKNLNLSQRIVNLYYGMISFASAEMIADPKGIHTLSEIENMTKNGHGLFTLDGNSENIFEGLKVGVLSNGFFRRYMDFNGKNTSDYPDRRPKKITDINDVYTCNLIELFSRIPEIEFIFSQVTEHRYNWLNINFDSDGNSLGYGGKKTPGSYLILADRSYEIAGDELRALPYGFKEVQYAESELPGLCYRVRIDNKENEYWFQTLPIHNSPFIRNSIIIPIFNDVYEYRALVTCILYALSIIVRYRPSIWRSVLKGELEKYRVMIEQFLDVVERITPEEFLKKITGKDIRVIMSGSIYS